MISQARDDLLRVYLREGGHDPISSTKAKRNWSKKVREFHETIESINLKINKLNMVVPTLRQQMFHFSAKREIEKILQSNDEIQKCSDNDDGFRSSASSSWRAGKEEEEGKTVRGRNFVETEEDRITLNIVLKELKALFNKS